MASTNNRNNEPDHYGRHTLCHKFVVPRFLQMHVSHHSNSASQIATSARPAAGQKASAPCFSPLSLIDEFGHNLQVLNTVHRLPFIALAVFFEGSLKLLSTEAFKFSPAVPHLKCHLSTAHNSCYLACALIFCLLR